MRSFFTSRVIKRGGSLYILVPANTVKDASLKEDDRVHVIIETTWDEEVNRP